MHNSYITVGHGPRRVLALHGWFGSARAWAPYTHVLDQDRYTYVFMDYRGYGGAKAMEGRYTIDEIASDAIAIADRLGWDRFSLLGHSMGGMAIQRVLVQAPQRVDKLVAVTPVPAGGVPFDDATWQFFSSAAKDARVRRAILDNTTGNRLSSYWLDAMVRHSQEQSIEQAFAAYLTAWAKTDFADQVKGNPVPVLVVVGEHDPALGAEFMKATWMQWYPNATLVTMRNAGHYPMDETPVALATEIERFLAG